MSTIDFDLELWRSGAYNVQTRRGKAVHNLHENAAPGQGRPQYPLVGIVDGDTITWSDAGKWVEGDGWRGTDLALVPKVQAFYVAAVHRPGYEYPSLTLPEPTHQKVRESGESIAGDAGGAVATVHKLEI